MSEIIKVDISVKDGIYLATSESLLGLCVAHRDIFIFINEIPEVIKSIYKAKYNEEVEVKAITEPKEKEEKGIKTINFITTKKVA